MLLLKGGRTMLTKMDPTLKVNCAFSNTAAMFCEVFKCPTHKEHEIKNKALLSECLLYYCVTVCLIMKSLAEVL
jgi:hypothetical protein